MPNLPRLRSARFRRIVPAHLPIVFNAMPDQPAPHPAVITTSLPLPEILARLEKAARRGDLPGFERGGQAISGTAAAFHVDADAVPFEGRLIATASAAFNELSGTTLHLHTRLKQRMPWVFFVVLALTAYPGVLLTESMIRTIVPGWAWLWSTVWWWYFPLSVISIPLALIPAIRKSRTMAARSAVAACVNISKLINAK